MKTINLYQVYRPKSKEYPWTTPVASESDDIALSCFKELAKTQPELSCSYLYHIGTMDVKTGKISLKRKARLIKDRSIKDRSTKEKSDEK